MNLQDIRDMVRVQMDLDDNDLPDLLLDQYVRDGYQRMIDLETRWPSFESLWTINKVAGPLTVEIPVDALEIDALITPDGVTLIRVDRRWAATAFNLAEPPTGSPRYWFRLGNLLYLYPTVSDELTLIAYGWRRPSDWVAAGASSPVDADERLHLSIVWYCCSVAYAQQEDEVLEATYMNRFKESSAIARDSVMRPWSGSPKRVAYTSYPRGGLHARQPTLYLKPPDIVEEDTTIIGGTP